MITENELQDFKKTVDSGDVRSVRIMLKDSILNDSSFKEFNQLWAYAKDMPDLIDTYNGESFQAPPWSDDYLASQMAAVLDNFTLERLEHYKEVVKALRPPKEPPVHRPKETKTPSSTNKPLPPPKETHKDRHTSYYHEKDTSAIKQRRVKTGVGISIAGVGGIVAGAVISSTALIALGTVATIAGGVTVATNIKR